MYARLGIMNNHMKNPMGETAGDPVAGTHSKTNLNAPESETQAPQTALTKTASLLGDIIAPLACSALLWGSVVAFARKKHRCGTKMLLAAVVLALPLIWYKEIYLPKKDDKEASG